MLHPVARVLLRISALVALCSVLLLGSRVARASTTICNRSTFPAAMGSATAAAGDSRHLAHGPRRICKFLKDKQRLAGVFSKKYLPFTLAPRAHDALDHLQELEIVVDEQDPLQNGGWV